MWISYLTIRSSVIRDFICAFHHLKAEQYLSKSQGAYLEICIHFIECLRFSRTVENYIIFFRAFFWRVFLLFLYLVLLKHLQYFFKSFINSIIDLALQLQYTKSIKVQNYRLFYCFSFDQNIAFNPSRVQIGYLS